MVALYSATLPGILGLEGILEGSSRLAINSIVFSEVAFNLLELLYVEKYGQYKFYDMKSKLSLLDHSVLRGYSLLQSFLDELQRENRLVYLPITLEIIGEASRQDRYPVWVVTKRCTNSSNL